MVAFQAGPEAGYPGNITPNWSVTAGPSFLATPDDPNLDLRFPWSVEIYDRMSRTDGQVGSVLRAITLPLLGARWDLVTDGVPDFVVQRVREDLGLPEPGGQVPRQRVSSIVWPEHLRQACKALIHGFACFEQVYEVTAGPEVHLRKLAPRLATTIDRILVSPDGGLEGVIQRPPLYNYMPGAQSTVVQGPFLGVDRVVVYSHEREGGDWFGTALALDTELPTPDGWSTMGRIQVGDRVFDETGTVRRVAAKSQVWKDRPTYRVRFSSGQEILADENHIWRVQSWLQRNRTAVHLRDETSDLTTKQLAEKVCYSGRHRNWAITQAGPLSYQRADLLIDPYVLGYWLGDGHSIAAVITTMDQDVVTEFELRGYPCKQRKLSVSAPKTLASSYGVGNDLQLKLRSMGLLGNKHVPDGYLRGSYQQRLDLLAGLMDSDGNIGGRKGQRAQFGNTNKGLSLAVLELARSLGGKANLYHDKIAGTTTTMRNGTVVHHRRDQYRVDFSLPDTPFRIGRKAAAYDSDRRRARTKHIIESIELIEPIDTVCIEVDSPSHLYLVGETLVPTHNSILRTSYKDWLVKDQLVRTNAQAIERNGMGVPVVTISDESQREEAARFVQEFRAGASAGGVLPAGCTLALVAPSGSPKDALPSIHMHNQEISQASLAMFLNLGHDVGARSLGETFVDVFTQSLQSLADWFAATATEHIIRDLVVHAFGPDVPYPILTAGDLSEQRVITAADLQLLVGAGAVTVDGELEAYVRKVNGLPVKPVNTPAEIAAWSPPPVGATGAAGLPAGTTVAPAAAEQRAQALMNRLQALTPTKPAKPATPTAPTTTGG